MECNVMSVRTHSESQNYNVNLADERATLIKDLTCMLCIQANRQNSGKQCYRRFFSVLEKNKIWSGITFVQARF